MNIQTILVTKPVLQTIWNYVIWLFCANHTHVTLERVVLWKLNAMFWAYSIKTNRKKIYWLKYGWFCCKILEVGDKQNSRWFFSPSDCFAIIFCFLLYFKNLIYKWWATLGNVKSCSIPTGDLTALDWP